MADVPEEHECAWRDKALHLEAEVDDLKARLAQLERMAFGRKSEKVPTPGHELRQQGRRVDPAKTQATRAERRRQKAELPEQRIEHAVPAEQCVCPKCGSQELSRLGEGEVQTLYERVPEHFVRHVHVLQKLACRCGEYVVTAPGPRRAAEQTSYGPGLIAHLVVSKCADSTPFYRLEKACKRAGMPLSRSTMVDLFHRAAREVEPLYDALMVHIAAQPVVQADETTLKLQKKTSKGWLWTFLAQDAIGYRFAESRSGQTPVEVLGGTSGTLVVDAYTGYNTVCTPEGRERAGCLAHVRRKLFEARKLAPADVDIALALILDVYRVEHDAREAGIVGTMKHLALRQSRSRAAMDALHEWLLEQEPKWPPKSGLGKAVRYPLRQWEALTVCLDDARVPVDNNASERALRVVALGRKNFLFVGHAKAGQNTAMLYSLVASCEANGVNPEAYLADVLLRVQTHPASRIEELLPHRWSSASA
ncbi:MAG: IS66 family transposase [Proteobacteria bacterium]|nr:IS66 family transposase [Pseudomonadota bacterium]MCP4894481.1 IS66 family transposase [Actinomycetales bacterium]